MPHPFHDKLFVFIGKPTRGSRQEIRDALSAVGGVTDENVTTFTDFVLAFDGSEKTKIYQRALSNAQGGFLSILSEDQFFDILEGKAAPPKKQAMKYVGELGWIPMDVPEEAEYELDRIKQDVIVSKRIASLAKHGVPTPEGRMKLDFRNLDKARRLARFMQEELGVVAPEHRCDFCTNPALVFISGEKGTESKLCIDCHNKQISNLTGVDVPEFPKKISVRDADRKPHIFEVGLMMFPHGMTLTAIEIGETRYMVDLFGGHDVGFDELWKSLMRYIEKLLSVKYMRQDGYFVKSKAIGYVEYNHEREAHDIIIDGKPYTWQELEKNVSSHEGFKIKIEFGDYSDILD